MPGVGALTAATLVGFLPELGHYSGKQLTALVGLAPWAQDSGQKQGYRSIRGGRGTVRRVLYLAALAAIRYNPDLRRFYQRLRDQGKTGKVALVAQAQAAAAAQRHCPATNPLGRTPYPNSIKKA